MNITFEHLKQELKEKNINLSYQRLKVLEYLYNNRCHPTVDQIYTSLHGELPTLSKTTVYNTLRVLAESGLVRVITIDDNETRYDIDIEDHGHFRCDSCGEIYDFAVDIGSINWGELEGFKINAKNIYFNGVCPDCLSEPKN